jgi:DNA helicase-4
LLKALFNLNSNCRLFCVGDDWQAIYGFSGASYNFMVNFHEYFENPAVVQLRNNYRNPEEVIDFGSEIINESVGRGIAKELQIINKEIENPIYLNRIEANSEYYYHINQNEAAFDLIRKLIKDGIETNQIMVLSRFNFGYSELKKKCREDPEIKEQ